MIQQRGISLHLLWSSLSSHSCVFWFSVYRPCTLFVRFIPNYFTFDAMVLISNFNFFPTCISFIMNYKKSYAYYFEDHTFSEGLTVVFLVSLPLSIFDCSLLVYRHTTCYFMFIFCLTTLINSLINSFWFCLFVLCFDRLYGIFT